MKTQDRLLDEMGGYVRRWAVMYRLWIGCHFLLGGLAVLAPLVLTTDVLEQTNLTPSVVALVAACAAGLVTFLRPDRYANGYFAVFSTLEIALKRCRFGVEGTWDHDDLIDAFEASRAHIGKMQPVQPIIRRV